MLVYAKGPLSDPSALVDLGPPEGLGGKVLTDSSGKSHVYVPGDSYLIQQGDVVLWEVRGPRVRKSFFNITKK